MTSKVKEFSKGEPVTVETGGKSQPKERALEKGKTEIRREYEPKKDKPAELIAVREFVKDDAGRG